MTQAPEKPARKKPGRKPEVDRQAMALAHKPNQALQIMALVQAGHSVEHIAKVGAYRGSWTEGDVWELFRRLGVRPPSQPFGGGAAPKGDARIVRLFEVQADVLREMCTGATDEQIARRLWLTPDTVTRYVAGVLEALDAHDRTHGVSLVLQGRVRILRALADD